MPRTDAEKEALATTWAQAAAIVVLVVGAVLIVVPAALHLGEAWKNPFEPATTVTTVVTRSPGKTETKTTTAEASRSFVERSLASGGLVLLRIGLVALAAFLAGAVVQRTILGVFAMKLGPLEVPELAKRTAEASNEALEEVKAELGRHAEGTQKAMVVAAGATEQAAAQAEQVAALAKQVAAVNQFFSELIQPGEGEREGEPEAGLKTGGEARGEVQSEPEQSPKPGQEESKK